MFWAGGDVCFQKHWFAIHVLLNFWHLFYSQRIAFLISRVKLCWVFIINPGHQENQTFQVTLQLHRECAARCYHLGAKYRPFGRDVWLLWTALTISAIAGTHFRTPWWKKTVSVYQWSHSLKVARCNRGYLAGFERQALRWEAADLGPTTRPHFKLSCTKNIVWAPSGSGGGVKSTL